MNVVWTRAALSDLAGIYEHIASDSPRYATAVVDRLTARSTQLAAFPRSGHMVPEFRRDDIRKVFVHSYRLIYQVSGASVAVLTVVHGARQLGDIVELP